MCHLVIKIGNYLPQLWFSFPALPTTLNLQPTQWKWTKWGNSFLCESLWASLFQRALWGEQPESRQLFQPSKNWHAAQETLSPDEELVGWVLEEIVPNSWGKSLLAHAQQCSSRLKTLSSFTLQWEILLHCAPISTCFHLLCILKTDPFHEKVTSLSCYSDQAAVHNGQRKWYAGPQRANARRDISVSSFSFLSTEREIISGRKKALFSKRLLVIPEKSLCLFPERDHLLDAVS